MSNKVLKDTYLLTGLKQDNEEVFSLLFNLYYKDLVVFCGCFIKEQETCEDIVQSIFIKLWNDRHKITIVTSIKSYLLKAVKNACYDEYKHQEVVRRHESQFVLLEDYHTENYILYSDLYTHLNKALDKIPEPYRETFVLNRFHDLKYKDIANKLNVSERTVEVRISKTLELLRKHLKDFLVLLLSITC